MRCNDIILGVGSEFAGTGPERSRSGRPMFRLWTRGRVVLLLGALGLPCLPAFRGWRDDPPMHRAPGIAAGPIEALAFSPDGEAIVTTDERGETRLRPGLAGRGLSRKIDAVARARVACFSPDGQALAIGWLEPDVALVDLSRGGPGRPLGIPVREASNLRFSPDGRTLAIASFRSPEIILWDLEAGRSRRTLRGHAWPVVGLAFAADGRSLATLAFPDPNVLVWDLATGRPRRFPTETYVTTGAFSLDGRLLATANAQSKTVRLWDVRSGGHFRLIAGLAEPIRSLALSPDGRLLATGAGDGTVDLWSVATGLGLRRLDAQADVIRHVAFSPDGRVLAATANDDDVRLWDLGGLGDPERSDAG